MIRRRCPAVVAAAAAVLTLSGCGPNLTWEQKLEALRHAADRGADAHYVLITKNQKPNKDTCTENYTVFMGTSDDPPNEYSGGSSSQEWRELHLSYFVDSCISGTPRQPATRPKTPTTTPQPTPSTTSTDASDGTDKQR